MCVNTYFDIPELLKYPLPFKAEDILLDSDFALQDGHQPAQKVMAEAIWAGSGSAVSGNTPFGL